MVLSWLYSIILRGKSATVLHQSINADLSESDAGCATGRVVHADGGAADWIAEGVGDLSSAWLHLAALKVVRGVLLLLLLLGSSSLRLSSGRLLLVDGEGRL